MEEDKLIFAQYCRKSSDNEDRQVQSIDTQIRELAEYSEKFGLDCPILLKESRSAFSEGRPEYERLVRTIRRGEANALLVIHTSRIARNPVDGARLIHLMDEGCLKEVRTLSNIYRNNPGDKMMLGLELIMSKKDSDDKSVMVKSGLKSKAVKGYPSGVSIVGYKNDPSGEKGDKKWIVDKVRFVLIQKLFQYFLTGRYSVKQLHVIAKDELCIRTPKRRVEGGKSIALSYLYKMLADPIYAGFFYYNGVRYELNKKLPRVITEEEYWTIQNMLGKKGRPKPQKRDALYNHFMRCEDCGGGVTPDFKFQLICSGCKHKFSYSNRDNCPKCEQEITGMNDPVYLTYVYYYCISRKKNGTCNKGGVSESQLEKQLIKELSDDIHISKELSQWCIKNVNQLEDKELDDAILIAQAKARELSGVEKRLSNLIDLRISKDPLSEAEIAMYDLKQAELTTILNKLKKSDFSPISSSQWKEELTKDFGLMVEIVDILKNGSFEDKKSVLEDFGSNLTMSGRKLSISYSEEINIFVEALKAAKAKNSSFEPKKSLADKDETDTFVSVCPTLLRR